MFFSQPSMNIMVETCQGLLLSKLSRANRPKERGTRILEHISCRSNSEARKSVLYHHKDPAHEAFISPTAAGGVTTRNMSFSCSEVNT